MNSQAECSTKSKIMDLVRPMTRCTMKEDLDLSFSFFEDENASEPCYSTKISGSKKLNLFRTVVFVGAMAAVMWAICALSSLMKKN